MSFPDPQQISINAGWRGENGGVGFTYGPCNPTPTPSPTLDLYSHPYVIYSIIGIFGTCLATLAIVANKRLTDLGEKQEKNGNRLTTVEETHVSTSARITKLEGTQEKNDAQISALCGSMSAFIAYKTAKKDSALAKDGPETVSSTNKVEKKFSFLDFFRSTPTH